MLKEDKSLRHLLRDAPLVVRRSCVHGWRSEAHLALFSFILAVSGFHVDAQLVFEPCP